MNTKNRLLILTSLASLMVIIPAVLADSFIKDPSLLSGSAIPMGLGAVGLFLWSNKIRSDAVSDKRKTLHWVAMFSAGGLFFINAGSLFVDLKGWTPILGVILVVVGIMIYVDSRKEKKEKIASAGTDEEQAEAEKDEEAIGHGDAEEMKKGHKLKGEAKDMKETEKKEEELKEEIAEEFKEEGEPVPEVLKEKLEEEEELEEKAEEELGQEESLEKMEQDAAATTEGVPERKVKRLRKAVRKAIFHQHKEEIKRIESDINLNEKEIKTLEKALGYEHIGKAEAKFKKRVETLKLENEELAKLKGIVEEHQKEYNKYIKTKDKISEEKKILIGPKQEEKEKFLKEYADLEKKIEKDLKEIRKGETDESINIQKIGVAMKERRGLAKAVREKIKKIDIEIEDYKMGKLEAAKAVEKAAPEEAAEAQAKETGEKEDVEEWDEEKLKIEEKEEAAEDWDEEKLKIEEE